MGPRGRGRRRPQPLLQWDPSEGPRSHLLAFSASETQGCSVTARGPASVSAGSWDWLSAATQANHPPASLTSVALSVRQRWAGRSLGPSRLPDTCGVQGNPATTVDGRWWVTGPASCLSEVNFEEDSVRVSGGSPAGLGPGCPWQEPAFTDFSPFLVPGPPQSLTLASWGHLPRELSALSPRLRLYFQGNPE